MAIDAGIFTLKTASDLFEKLKRDYRTLCSKPADADACFNFFVTAHHLPEWHCHSDGAAAADLRKSEPILQVCAQLAIGAKHYVATDRDYSSVIATNRYTAQKLGAAIPGSQLTDSDSREEFFIEYQVENEPRRTQEISVTELAQRIVTFWEDNLRRGSILHGGNRHSPEPRSGRRLQGRWMPKPKKLHIDADGVRRGYYVYVHRDRATGDVFYVGKGHGNRAWDGNGRNDDWTKRVATLSKGWEVQIVHDNLSEIDAFELEAELVEEHGGPAATGGKLTNWIPGGETPAAVGIRIQLDDNGWFEAYYQARCFLPLRRGEQERIASATASQLDPIVDQLSKLEDEADNTDDGKLFENVSDISCIIDSLLDSSSEFLRRRVSWKDVGIATEDALDEIELELEDIDEYDPRVAGLLKQALVEMKTLYAAIDSGNRTEAEEAAKRSCQGR